MPYYRRGYRRGYGRAYRRWYGRRGWTRSWRRGGLSRRIASGTRTFSMTVPMENLFSVVFPANEYNSVVQCISPFMYAPGSAHPELYCCPLIQSQLYRTYCQLYDEVKVDWCSYEISIVDPVGSGNYIAIRLWTAVDRRVTRQDFDDGERPTAAQIRNMSSAQGTMFVNNSRAIVRRYIAASDLGERITYHDCSFTTIAGPPLVYRDNAWYDAVNNLTFFSPGMWFYIESTDAVSTQRSINVSVKCKYGVTFRNAKFGLSVTGNAGPKSVAAVLDKRDVPSVEVLPELEEKTEDEVVKPALTGMAKDAVARLALNVSDNCDEYVTGENDFKEDLEFLISKMGIDGVRKYFPEGSCLEYDKYLKERGDMDDDVTELVKDSKS